VVPPLAIAGGKHADRVSSGVYDGEMSELSEAFTEAVGGTAGERVVHHVERMEHFLDVAGRVLDESYDGGAACARLAEAHAAAVHAIVAAGRFTGATTPPAARP
jgi:hypothetical protein